MAEAPAAAGPRERYRAGVAAGEWQDDPAQEVGLAALERVWRELETPGRHPPWPFFRRQRAAPRGLYLWGRVGRGKTFLCDLFYAAVSEPRKCRVHFHQFMQDVQAALRKRDGQRDPLVEVAADLARKIRLLCLDEFFVSDIGDAMILGNLLEALFARHVVLVTTSNTPPADLYRDGLQRERFLPAIALLQAHCDVVELASGHDWRLRALRQAPMYCTPVGADAERGLASIFNRFVQGPARQDFKLALNGRTVPVKRAADGVIWFEFTALCEGPRGVADYLELARMFHTIIISNVPQFTPLTDDAARRFIELVDEAYDRSVKLVLSVAVPIVELYDGERLRAEFARTESRLIEMQSEAYLAREHRA
ncbi:cell division protein ZapE [Dokdonella sp.]|uniref:cell division protein ZapE n=1 Tax=Dokdonella sp. TaxID=2291710 RepID=UPI0031BDE857|nr:cell division protein ZapE [Dokdonella sp.]